MDRILCPHCGLETSVVVQGQNVQEYARYDLETGDRFETAESYGNDIFGYYCDGCGEPFTAAKTAEIDAAIN